MKLDLSRAWSEAMRMLAANRELVLVIAGLFLFLPFLAFMLQLPPEGALGLPEGAQPSPDQVNEALGRFLTENWLALLLVGLAQMAAAVALIKVLADRSRPTVKAALAAVPVLLLPMIGTQLASSIAAQVPMMLAGVLPETAAALMALIAIPLTFYLLVKFSLVSPALVLNDWRNPLKAVRESWQSTRGNSFRLFAFFVLLFVAGIVILLVTNLFFGLLFALLGERGEAIASAIFLSLAIAVAYTVAYAVVAAVYRQLTSEPAASVPRAGRHGDGP